MKYIKLVLENLDIKPNSEIKGHVTVDYPGHMMELLSIL